VLCDDFLDLDRAERRKENAIEPCLFRLLLDLLVDVLGIGKDKRLFSVVHGHEPHPRVKVFELCELLFLVGLRTKHQRVKSLVVFGFLHGLVKLVKVLKPLKVFSLESLELLLLVILKKV
jgi:hypothetical protein